MPRFPQPAVTHHKELNPLGYQPQNKIQSIRSATRLRDGRNQPKKIKVEKPKMKCAMPRTPLMCR